MRIFFSGATSDTGSRVLKKLVAKVGEDAITCLVRPTSNLAIIKQLGVKFVIGDVTEPETLTSVLNSGYVYLDMTHPKYYHKSLESIINAGVERAYFITTTGIFSQYNQFSQIYKDNEAKIQASGIVYTILRPSMIYGSLQDKNMHKLIQFLYRYPVFPLFGAGKSLMQPVHAEDLADGIVAAIGRSHTENQEYNLAGPIGISYRKIIDIILSKLNQKVLIVNIQTSLAAKITKYAQILPNFPITEEQVLRLKEDKVFDISKAIDQLSFSPRSFENGIDSEIEEMCQAGVIRQGEKLEG